MQIIAPDLGIRNRAETKLLIHPNATIVDSSVGGGHAITNTSVSVIADSTSPNGSGKALSYNGTTSFLSVADSTDWSGICGSAEWTIEMWVYPTGGGALIARHHYTDPTTGFMFAVDSTSIYAYFSVVSGTAYRFSAITFSAWHHIAFVRSADGYIRCAADGIFHSNIVSAALSNYATPLTIGRVPINPPVGYFTGRMAEIKITKRAVYRRNFTPLSRAA